MLKSQNATTLKDNENVYVMEISLKQSYSRMQKLIENFQPKAEESDSSRSQDRDDHDLGVVFVDVNQKVMNKWIKRCQATLASF